MAVLSGMPGHDLSLEIVPSHGAVPSNTRFLWSTRVQITNGILSGSAVFAQPTSECPYTLK